MRERSYRRIAVAAAYVFLACISTWATTESISKLDPEWAGNYAAVVFIWVFSVILFCIAAFGTSLVVNSIDRSERGNNRTAKMLSGLAIMLVSWIALILPTNTHTFFYKAVIKNKTVAELKFIEGKLRDLLDMEETGRVMAREKQMLCCTVSDLFRQYASEMNHPGLPGNGDRAEKILVDLQNTLGGKLQRLRLASGDPVDRRNLVAAMQRQVTSLRDQKMAGYDLKLANLNRGIDEKEVVALLQNIQAIELRLTQDRDGLLPPREAGIAATRPTLIAAYRVIGRYGDELQKAYPAVGSLLSYRTPEIVQLEKVPEVWQNFFRGAYRGQGFVFWIIVAALIDFAGFVTFHYAFRPTQGL